MSTSYGLVGYPDVPRSEAAHVLRACEAALRGGGWITGDEDPEAAHSSKGHAFRPGPAWRESYGSLNGVVFCGPGYLNHGPFISGPDFRCPACGAFHEAGQGSTGWDAQQERCFDLFGRYSKGDAPLREVACVACEALVDINAMVDGGAEFVLSDVAIEFWNWPPDSMEAAAAVLDACLGRRHRPGWVRI